MLQGDAIQGSIDCIGSIFSFKNCSVVHIEAYQTYAAI